MCIFLGLGGGGEDIPTYDTYGVLSYAMIYVTMNLIIKILPMSDPKVSVAFAKTTVEETRVVCPR